MARMNISIPDPLYERLDRLRNRVNASKVCASALEKELDMIEARPSPVDPEIEQLVQRLQGLRERWYERGREDGKRWAVTSATRDELYRFFDEYGTEKGEELSQTLLHHQHGPRPWRPAGVDFKASLERWLDRDGVTETSADGEDSGQSFSAARTEVDEAGYLEGWRDVIKEIWKTVSPRLKQ